MYLIVLTLYKLVLKDSLDVQDRNDRQLNINLKKMVSKNFKKNCSNFTINLASFSSSLFCLR